MSKCALPQEEGLILSKTPDDIIHRFEKIDTKIFNGEFCAVNAVADEIVQTIEEFNKKNAGNKLFNLGLSTGKTPLHLYKELVKRHKAGLVSFKNVAVYTLDEFYPIESTTKQSRNYVIHSKFINHIDIDPKNVFIPDATTPFDKISEYCNSYAKDVVMDIMLLGIGKQGQVGFNEPGTYAKSTTRLVKLSYNSRKHIAGAFYGFESTPRMAITMGLGTILNSKRVILLAWGEDKAEIVQKTVEGEYTEQIPSTILQKHDNITAFIDTNAATDLTIMQTPWRIGQCNWTPRFVRKAVIWLCGVVNKPILRLTYNDYVENSLGELLETVGAYDKINITVFNALQHIITGWPGGKPNAESEDKTRPVASNPFPKKVLIFSPHPDDDVISMGGTFYRLIQNGHDVHVAYQVSGNVAVHDDVVLQSLDTAKEIGLGDRYEEIVKLIREQKAGEPQSRVILDLKGAIRRAEAKAACRAFGLNDKTNSHFLNLPFYETGGIKKGEMGQADIDIIKSLLQELKPHQIYLAGDFTDPHGTHRVCAEAIIEAISQIIEEDWLKGTQIWLYRGAWQEWSLASVDMAVPLSPDEVIKKRHAIYRHLSQKDIVPFPGDDSREFWQRAEDRTQNTARLYDALGMAEYQAMEVFVEFPLDTLR